jgi:hypothetical protein
MGVKFTALSTALLLFAAGTVVAQTAGVVSLRASSTSAQGSMAPVLTWSTNPTATSCRASGGWSGDKAVNGTQTLPTINANTSYTLTCTWGSGSSVVSWVAPTANTDGSTLTNLAGFRVYYGTSSTTLTQTQTLNDVTARSATISGLAPGTWYFAVRTLNTRSEESANSNIASRAVTGATASNVVSITITNPTPPPPPPPPTGTLRTTSTAVYDYVLSGSTYIVGRRIGTIALGRPCTRDMQIGNYYRVFSEDVAYTLRPRMRWPIAQCAVQ